MPRVTAGLLKLFLFTWKLKEDQQRALLRREFELQSLSLQRRLEQKFWSQEKNMLVQESQQFKHNFLLLFMKLRWFLKRWRQGKVLPSERDDFLEVCFLWDWARGGGWYGDQVKGGMGLIGPEEHSAGIGTALRFLYKPSAFRLHSACENQLLTGRWDRSWGYRGEEDVLASAGENLLAGLVRL